MEGRASPHMPSKIIRPSHQTFNLKRWYRGKRDTSTWDGLRRDIDLFDESADCSVFLYAKGRSKRGPAFRLPRQKLVDARCEPLLSSAYPATQSNHGSYSRQTELFIPAPAGLMREEALRSHIATRNFFAWLCQKPLVGRTLGEALADLFGRMTAWRSAHVDNVEETLMYADQMGYSSVEHRPDNALAMLAFSEKARVRHVWIDSFAHCTGMNDEIGRSSEFAPISKATKALITRAYLEMDLHLDRTSRSLVNFLENELSASYLGLSDGARKHLDNFRSFLHSYHVGKHGYWPPYRPTNFPKDLYYDLYYDFSCLYHYLADKDVSKAHNVLKSMNGGVCVQQNIEQFNARHKFNPLPFALPLIPRSTPGGMMRSQKSLRSFKFGVRDTSASRAARIDQNRLELRRATNQSDTSILRSSLVQQYDTWEDSYAAQADVNVPVSEARKVRWILIYGVLQTLVSAIQAPSEVRDTTTARYPLCILTSGLPPWDENTTFEQQQVTSVAEDPSHEPPDRDEVSRENAATPTPSIHPDCEGQSYQDYWSHSNSSGEISNTQAKSSLRRASARLRKSSLKRRSLVQQAESKRISQPELVFGRTLAELAYGDNSSSSINDCEAYQDFDFGFDRHPPKLDPRPSVDEEEVMRTTSIAWSSHSTFDEFHDSLSSHGVAYSTNDTLDTASIPSLTYSHGSRETVESFHSGYSRTTDSDGSTIDTPTSDLSRANSKDSEKAAETANQRLATAKEANGISKLHPEQFSPNIVSSFTDYMRKEVDSNASSPGSIVSGIDRAAVITNDGDLEHSMMDSYRMLTVS